MNQRRETNDSLDSCPLWVQFHPDLVPWHQGKARLEKRLLEWRNQYSPTVYDVFIPSENRNDVLFGKILACYLFHWESAGTFRHGDEIARSLEKGIGFQKGGKLGGNPIFDLILAAALCAMQKRAYEYYTEKYRLFLKGIAGNCGAFSAKEEECPVWWNPFFFYLVHGNAQKEDSTPALLSYAGKCGLKGWLGRALVTFLPRWRKSEISRQSENDVYEQDPPDLQARSGEEKRLIAIIERIEQALREARNLLEPSEKTRIALFYVSGMENKKIAQLFGETESTSSRRRVAALDKFRTQFFRILRESPGLEEELTDLWPSLRNDIKSLFFDFLKEDERDGEEGKE